MYESNRSNCVLCLSISKMEKYSHSSLLLFPTSRTASLQFRLYEYFYVNASKPEFLITLHSSSTSSLPIKSWPTARLLLHIDE